MRELRRALGDAYLVNEFADPPAKYLLCRGNDLADVVSRTHAVEKLQGVRMVSVTLNRERVFANQFIHRLIREKIEELEKARS